MKLGAAHACHRETLRGCRRQSHRRADEEGQRNADPEAEQAARVRRLLPDRGWQRRHDLGQPLRYVGACRRVDSPRIQLGARREAGERASECAEDHLRRGDRAAQDERVRSGISLDGAGKARNSRAFPSRKYLMKTITTTASLRKPDSSTDATLNPVAVSWGAIVSCAFAFPRPGLVICGTSMQPAR